MDMSYHWWYVTLTRRCHHQLLKLSLTVVF